MREAEYIGGRVKAIVEKVAEQYCLLLLFRFPSLSAESFHFLLSRVCRRFGAIPNNFLLWVLKVSLTEASKCQNQKIRMFMLTKYTPPFRQVSCSLQFSTAGCNEHIHAIVFAATFGYLAVLFFILSSTNAMIIFALTKC
jgi:hypothetical protein